jgi:hypothetical protein
MKTKFRCDPSQPYDFLDLETKLRKYLVNKRIIYDEKRFIKRINKKYAQPLNKFHPTQKFSKDSEDITNKIWDETRLVHNQTNAESLKELITSQPPQRGFPDYEEIDIANEKG